MGHVTSRRRCRFRLLITFEDTKINHAAPTLHDSLRTMALKRRHVAFAGLSTFIAWGLASSWAPILQYLGYAFLAGGIFTLASLGALVFLSTRKTQDLNPALQPLSKVAAFIHPKAWELETAWLSGSAVYQRTSLYPSSAAISESLDNLIGWLLRDLVTSWYRNITPRQNFVHEVDHAIRTAFGSIQGRTVGIDGVEIAVSRIVPLITSHLKDFYDAERVIRGKDLSRNFTESEELDLAIARKYRDGQLHPAASLTFADMKLVQQEYMRKIVTRLLPEILPESMIRSRAVTVLIKEILSCAVLEPLMRILSDPDTWNQLMEAYV